MATESEPDSLDNFKSEMDLAMSRYRAGINAGYSDDDAKQMYLLPTQQKWSILRQVPDAAKEEAAKELDDAHLEFLKGMQSGYKGQDAKSMFLDPVQEKWQMAASIPTPDPKEAYKAGALRMVASGLPVQDIVNANERNIMADPKFVARLEEAGMQGVRAERIMQHQADMQKRAAAALAEKQSNPAFLFTQASKILNEPLPPTTDPNYDAMRTIQQQIGGQTLNKLTNSPAFLSPGPVSFEPPAEDLPSGPSTGPRHFGTKYRTAQDVGEAYRNKELTREEAKLILNGQFGIK